MSHVYLNNGISYKDTIDTIFLTENSIISLSTLKCTEEPFDNVFHDMTIFSEISDKIH